MIQTAKLNGREPLAYLADVLRHAASGRTKSHELHTLPPWAWRPEPKAAAPPPQKAVAA